MEPLLINKTDFAPYRNLTLNMEDSKRLEPYILEAQRIDLCNLLGKRLYFDLIKHTGSYLAGITAQTEQAPYQPTSNELWFQKLLNGTSYNYTWPDQSVSVKIYAGIKPVLVYLSFARFVRNDNIRSTQSGFVKKTTDFSTQISEKDIQAIATRAETDANAFFSDTEDYMNDHSEFFNTYRNSSCAANESFRDKRKGSRLTAVAGRNYLRNTKRFI